MTIRIGDSTPKGYKRADLVDAWSRYLAEGLGRGGVVLDQEQESRGGEEALESDLGVPPQESDTSATSATDRLFGECETCNSPMVIVEPGQTTHPTCDPEENGQ
jgi:hypothetical protein